MGRNNSRRTRDGNMRMEFILGTPGMEERLNRRRANNPRKHRHHQSMKMRKSQVEG